MLEILKYSAEYKSIWDDLISKSKNGTFLFFRDFMEYHSDRFLDYSFIIFKNGKVEAVLPGNIVNQTYYSHQGLTYGGFIFTSKLSTKDILEIFQIFILELKHIGIKELIYKPVPFIYHILPSQEDLYALFKFKAEKIGCNISSTIFQNNKIKFIESRKSGIRKSIKEGVKIFETEDFQEFWNILNNNLVQKHDTKPVHSLDEITYLKSKFNDNIKLYVAQFNNEIVAGTVIFEMKNIVHVQYISANEEGKHIGALDYLFDELINNKYINVPVFDFGQSTEQGGNYLNENLIFQKEGFGGRGICYDIYKINI